MSGIINPGQRRTDSALDLVVKGLQIARDVYGIKEAATAAERADEERKSKEADADRKKRGIRTPTEFQEIRLKGFEEVPEGPDGIRIPVQQDDGSVLTKFVREKQKAAKEPGTRVVTTVENGRPVEKIVADQAGTSYPAYVKPDRDKEPKDYTREDRDRLQAQYDKDPEVRKNKAVLQSYSEVQALAQDTSPAGDLALVFSYMKALDPGSVVKESEVETAQALGSLQDRAKAKLEQMSGGGNLSPRQRQDLINQVEKLAANSAKNLETIESQFVDQASRRKVSQEDLRFTSKPQFAPKDTVKAPQEPFADGNGSAQAAPAPPKVGTEENGFVFQGGDPADPKNWKPLGAPVKGAL
jgi:hypothetical protein